MKRKPSIKSSNTWGNFSILYTWLLSYLTVCVFLFSCNFFLYISHNKTTRNYIEKQHAAFLNSIVLQFNSRISLADNIHASLSSAGVVNDVISSAGPLSTEKTLPLALELVNQIKNTSFYSAYIYIPDKNVIVSNTVSDSPKNFYLSYYSDTDISYERWLSVLSSASHGSSISTFNGKERVLDLLYPISVSPSSQGDAVLVCRMNDIILKELSFAEDRLGSTVILDSKSNIIMSDTPIVPDDFKYDSYTDGIIETENNVALCITSKYTKWKFIYTSSPEQFYSAALKTQNMQLILIAVSMLICSILSVVFAVYNYRPLSKLFSAYLLNNGISPVKKKISFSMSQQALDDYNSSKHNMRLFEKKLKEQNFNAKLYSLLRSSHVSISHDFDSFLSECFNIILLRPYNAENIFNNESTAESSEDYAFVITQNILEELLNDSEDFFKLIKFDNFYAGLYYYKNRSKAHTQKAKFLQNFSYANKVIHENFNFGFDAGISSVRSGVADISLARKEAQYSLEVAKPGSGDVVFFEELNDSNTIISVDYMELLDSHKHSLYTYIEQGDCEHAKQYLHKLRILCTKSLSIERTQIVIIQIAGELLCVIDRLNISSPPTNLNEIASGISFDTSWQILEDMIENICKELAKNAQQQSDNLLGTAPFLNEILSYVNSNYSDPNLSLDYIANNFGFSTRYISKFFKNETGESLSNYITQFRIEKAKLLLKTTKMPITAIYQQCGFVSEKTFFRSFAKYEVLTPRKYREQNQI